MFCIVGATICKEGISRADIRLERKCVHMDAKSAT